MNLDQVSTSCHLTEVKTLSPSSPAQALHHGQVFNTHMYIFFSFILKFICTPFLDGKGCVCGHLLFPPLPPLLILSVLSAGWEYTKGYVRSSREWTEAAGTLHLLSTLLQSHPSLLLLPLLCSTHHRAWAVPPPTLRGLLFSTDTYFCLHHPHR